MGQSLSKVYVHITFSTKNHYPFIDESIQDSLFEYLGGIFKKLNCNPIQIGGYRDHVHILCLLSKHVPQTKLLEEIKKNSSKWIKGKRPGYSNFYWQDGYAIFSVNPAQLNVVFTYIKTQAEHDTKRSFKDELRMLFMKYNIDFASPGASLRRPMDERYVWD